ncbi:MAG: hypothetical protein ABFD64_01010 [Armatimonadota bacterium]
MGNCVGAFGPSQAGEKYVSRREFARRMGISLTAVQKAIERGIIKVYDVGGPHTMIDFEEAKADYEASRSARNNNRYGELSGDDNGEDSAGQEDNEKWGIRKTRAEALLTEEKHAKAQLEREELEGVLHRADDVEAVIIAIFMSFRSRILAMPSKLAQRIASMTGSKNIADIQKLLDDSCKEALSELARYDPHQIAEERDRRRKKK